VSDFSEFVVVVVDVVVKRMYLWHLLGAGLMTKVYGWSVWQLCLAELIWQSAPIFSCSAPCRDIETCFGDGPNCLLWCCTDWKCICAVVYSCMC